MLGNGVLGQHIHQHAAVGHAGGLGGAGFHHKLKHLHQHLTAALIKGHAVLSALGHGFAGGVHPGGEFRVLDQLGHGLALKLAEIHLF